jgi:hypothetical protein
MISRNGVKVSAKNFADLKYGSEHKALEAAKKHRDGVLERFPPISKIEVCNILRSTNTSGMAGVNRRQRTENYAYWEARTQLPGNVIRSKKFSVSKYGEDGARKKAIEERAKQLKEIEGQPYLHSPSARRLYLVLAERRNQAAPCSAVHLSD